MAGGAVGWQESKPRCGRGENRLASRRLEAQLSKSKGHRRQYLPSRDPLEVLGIGPRKKIDKLEVHWPLPSVRVDTFAELLVDRYLTIIEAPASATPC